MSAQVCALPAVSAATPFARSVTGTGTLLFASEPLPSWPQPLLPQHSAPPLVVSAQVWGVLLAHYAVREVMARAADGAGYDPDRMGFAHAVRVVRRAAQGGAAFSP